jgi:hypothetical protein
MNQRFSVMSWLSFAPLIAALLLCGCNREPPGGIVRGKVSYNGKALEKGSIVFYPSSNAQVCHGNIQKDGSFKLENQVRTERIEPGKYTAVIVADNTEIAAMKEDPLFPVQPTVPFKFASVTTSPLKYDVVIGENEFDVNLDKFK